MVDLRLFDQRHARDVLAWDMGNAPDRLVDGFYGLAEEEIRIVEC